MALRRKIPDTVMRWRNPAATPGEVFAVAHRGAFCRDGVVVAAENSIPAIRRARDLGCDMVELDVRFTSDGTAVLLHDSKLDRTTSMKGYIASHRYQDIRNLPLLHPADRTAFNATIPSLEDGLLALGRNMMANIECKTGIDAIPAVAAVAARAGVSDQVTVKTNNAVAGMKELMEILTSLEKPIEYIPVLRDSRDGLEQLARVASSGAINCVECVVDFPRGSGAHPMYAHEHFTMDGGVLFSIPARRIAREHNFRLFVNTLTTDPKNRGEQWAGGRNCQLARLHPDSVYGFWIAHGATVIQSDEPEFLLGYLRRSGFRRDKSGS